MGGHVPPNLKKKKSMGKSGQVKLGKVRPCQVRSDKLDSGQVRSGPVSSLQVRSDEVMSGQARLY